MNDSGNADPVRIVWDVLYDTASGVTGLIGLTPVQFIATLLGLMFVYLVANWIRTMWGDPGWSLDYGDDDDGRRQGDVAVPSSRRPDGH